MNRALRPTTDEERAEQIAHDKIILFREGWPDMHQAPEPDHMEGEWPPGAGILIAGIVGGVLWVVIGVVAWWAGVI